MDELEFAEVAALVEGVIAESLAGIAAEARRIGSGWMICDGPGSFMTKAAGFSAAPSEAEIDAICEYFVPRGIEPRVELSAFVASAALPALEKRGFVLREVEDVLTARLPADSKSLPSHVMPDGLTISPVDLADEAAVEIYLRVAGSGFFAENEPLPEIYLDGARRMTTLRGYQGFVARIGDEIVGGGACTNDGGLTSLFGVSVKPAFRRRGIQQALIAARLAHGIASGSKLAAIGSRPGMPTARNASRFNFSLAYSKVCMARPGEGLVPSP